MFPLAFIVLIVMAPPAPKCLQVPEGAVSFDTASTAALAGAYQINFVDTTNARHHFPTIDLVLWVNDSAHRYEFVAPRIGYRAGERVLGGSFKEKGGAWVEPDNKYRGVRLNRSTMYLGDDGVNDGVGTYFRIRWINRVGFFGQWTSNMGIAVLIDSLGNTLPDPAGYFCAFRVKPFPKAPVQPGRKGA